MVTYKTPGVYLEEIQKIPPSVAPIATAIPAFIGHTEKAGDGDARPLHLRPTRISSLVEFEYWFGGPQGEEGFEVTISDTPSGRVVKVDLPEDKRSKHILYYALQHFYANGGQAAYIVSVGGYLSTGTALTLESLQNGIAPLDLEDEPTIVVIPEAQGLPQVGDFSELEKSALQHCLRRRDRFVIMDVYGGGGVPEDGQPFFDMTATITLFRKELEGTQEELRYGAAYAPNLETRLRYAYKDEETTVKYPGEDAGKPLSEVTDTVISNLARAALRDKTLVLPPSGAIAGVYAKVDATRGVWKAPANIPIDLVVRPTINLTSSQNDEMNVDSSGKSVNAIRSFVGKGTLVWGARTLDGNDNEWRYVSVRRFFIFVEESIKASIERFVFEPNDVNTWVQVRAVIENFLTIQWRAGALQGSKPERAFRVDVGPNTMHPEDILSGLMIIEIALAVVRPAEFIVLRFSHKLAEI